MSALAISSPWARGRATAAQSAQYDGGQDLFVVTKG
jgi:hypothetical protein